MCSYFIIIIDGITNRNPNTSSEKYIRQKDILKESDKQMILVSENVAFRTNSITI